MAGSTTHYNLIKPAATDTSEIITDLNSNYDDIDSILYDKADKDADAVSGNIAKFDANGNPIDSSMSSSDTSDAISKKHTQNTDTGTTSQTFQLQSGSSGAKLKNNSGVVEIRNSADSAYAGLRILNLYVSSSTVSFYTTSNLTYYVNPSTGNDSNDGSSGSPFATVAKAVSMIPLIINHNVTINLADGNYSEGISLTGCIGRGFLDITGNTETPSNVVFTGQILVAYVNVRTYIRGLKTTYTSKYGINVYSSSSRIDFDSIICTDSASYAGLYVAGCPVVTVSNSTFSNRNEGIFATNNTHLVSNTNSGSDNTTGLRAISSVIMKVSTQPGGTTAESTTYGGVIR